jgi:hypothetical protein
MIGRIVVQASMGKNVIKIPSRPTRWAWWSTPAILINLGGTGRRVVCIYIYIYIKPYLILEVIIRIKNNTCS